MTSLYLTLRHLNTQLASARHGIARINAKIEKGQLQLVGIHHRCWQILRQLKSDMNERSKRAVDQLAHAADKTGH